MAKSWLRMCDPFVPQMAKQPFPTAFDTACHKRGHKLKGQLAIDTERGRKRKRKRKRERERERKREREKKKDRETQKESKNFS